jgi:large subunit ribosomal protein L4
MMEVPVRNLRGEVVSTAQLDERVWDITPNVAVLHQAVVAQQANARRGTADTKTRGEVRGSTRKHHRQKGTGLARQGSVRAPHWRGGGVVFGPHPRDWRQDLPKKMRRLAMRSALSAKVDDQALVLVESWELPATKTKEMLRALSALDVTRGALVVLPEPDTLVVRASANIPRVRAVTPNTLNLLDVLKADHLIFTPAAAEAVTERLLRPARPKKSASLMSAPRVRTVRPKGVKKDRTAAVAPDAALAENPAEGDADTQERRG